MVTFHKWPPIYLQQAQLCSSILHFQSFHNCLLYRVNEPYKPVVSANPGKVSPVSVYNGWFAVLLAITIPFCHGKWGVCCIINYWAVTQVSTDSKCCSWGCKMASIIKIWLDVLIITLGVKIVSKQNESNKKIKNLAYHSPVIVESASGPLSSYWNLNFS